MELMIVVTIIAILAAIAYPSYLNQVRKSYRADAQANLMELAVFLERFYTENNTYAGAAIPSNLEDVPESGALRYKLTIESQDATSFNIKATAQSGTGQDADSCGDMTMVQTGAKTPANCW